MKRFVAAFLHFFYDKELLEVSKENAANYISITGAWFARHSSLLFLVSLLIYLDTKELSMSFWVLRWVAIGLALFASLADNLDGRVARSVGEITLFGKIADPHYDKVQYVHKSLSLILDGFLVYLLTENYLVLLCAVALFVVTLERNRSVDLHRLWVSKRSPNQTLEARFSGKARTAVCFAGFPLAHVLLLPGNLFELFYIVCGLMLFVTIWSLADYVRGYREIVRMAQRHTSKSEQGAAEVVDQNVVSIIRRT